MLTHGAAAVRLYRSTNHGLKPTRKLLALFESLELRQLLSAGQPDPTFGGVGGTGVASPGGEMFALQGDKTIQVSPVYNSVPNEFVPTLRVTRLDVNGDVDPTFTPTDLRGIVSNGDLSTELDAIDVKVTPSGKIVVLGSAVNDQSNADWYLAQINPNGGLDTSFSGDGQLAKSFGFSADLPAEMVIQSNGKIVVGGAPGHKSFALARWNTDGTLDTSFGDGGVTKFVYGKDRQGIEELALGANDSIIAAGRTQDDPSGDDRVVALMKFDSNGHLDTSFATAGARKLTGFSYIDDLAVGADGNIYLAKGLSNSNSMSVYRFKSTGFTDTSYGIGGNATVTFPKGDGTFYSVDAEALIVQSNSEAIVGGGNAFARFDANGAVDASFGNLGRTVINNISIGDPNSIEPSFMLLADGRFEAGGEGHLVRLTADAQSAAFASVDANGVLTVTGTAGNDTINVALASGLVTVTLNANSLSFDATTIKSVQIDAGGGDDGVTSSLNLPQTILGSAGNDTLHGGPAGDYLNGGSGDDKLFGDDGNDSLDGGIGQNQLHGNGGDDVADYLNQGGTLFELSTAFQADQSGGVSIVPLAIKKNHGAGVDLFDVEDSFNIVGTPGNDAFTGNVSVPLNIDGGLGDDSFSVGRTKSSLGRVTVSGNTGNDTFTITNADTAPTAIYGNDGDDTLTTAGLVGFTDGGDGLDTEDYRPFTTGKSGQTITIGANTEVLYGPNTSSVLVGRSSVYYGYLSNKIFAGTGNDTIQGHASNETLSGGAGNDVLQGSSGSDDLIGGPGSDQLYGGGGGDIADYSDHTQNLVITLDNKANDGAAGENDFIHSDVEDVIGGSGNDSITGDAKGNDLKGGPGHDTIHGGDGYDTLWGDGSSDTLFGDAGNDVFWAKDGNVDSIDGGRGDDALYSYDHSSTVKDKLVSVP